MPPPSFRSASGPCSCLHAPSKNLRKIKGGRFIHQVRKMRIVTHSYRSDVHVYDAPTGAGSSARILLFDRARRRSLRPFARSAHPDECDDPHPGSRRWRKEKRRNDGRFRNPPCQRVRARAAEPVVRALDDIVCHDGYVAQREAAPVSPDRSAWIGGHGTEP